MAFSVPDVLLLYLFWRLDWLCWSLLGRGWRRVRNWRAARRRGRCWLRRWHRSWHRVGHWW